MSRRKQLKPQHIQINDLSLNKPAEDSCVCSGSPAVGRCAHMCRRCCAEFSLLSELEQHQTVCSPDPPVLIVSEDDDLLSVSKTLPAASLPAGPAGELSGPVINFEMENTNSPSQDRLYKHAEFMNYRRSSHGGAESSENIRSNQSISKTDAVLCTSVLSESLPHPGCSADQEAYSWRRNEVFIENLESAEVALAQFSQLMDSDSHHSKTSISSLLQQLLVLQIQQIHQLQLTDHIRHQVLLFASHLAKMPDTLLICTKDLPSSDPFSHLRALSAHLSQELAAAAGTAKFLSTQHFTPTEQLNQCRCTGKDVLSSSESSQTFSELMMTAIHKHVSKEQHMGCGSADTQFNFLSQTKMSSLMFNKDSFPNISVVVEDLDALAALAQQRKSKNLKLFTPNTSPTECICKHKCRFCTKTFGKDNALEIGLRSHAGERPYRCNVCGNRFSTRGNLKVHVERHRERQPHIKTNLYHVPEQLDNIQTNAGISFGRSLSPETAAARLRDSSPSSAPVTSACREQSDSTNMSPFIKKEDDLMSVPVAQGDLYFASAASMDSAETRQRRTMNLKSEDVKTPFNVSKFVTKQSEESVDVSPNPFTHPTSTSFSQLLSIKCSDSPKPQLLSVNADRRASDPNECVICHRVLSCQSALRMHHRTHTGERPYRCQLCGRAFTTKGNLNTHQAVHRATVPLSVQHSCPICQSKFTNAVVLQQHVHMHMGGHLAKVNQKYSDYKEGFGDETKLSYRKNEEDDNNGSFCDNRFKSLSIHLSPFSKNLIDANKRTSYQGPHEELQFEWIKTEWSEGSNEKCCQTNNKAAAERGQWTRTLSNCSASEPSLSPSGQTSASSRTANLNEPFETWLDSTALMLQTSATVPTDQKPFHSLRVGHSLREKGVQKNNYCDICGKNFACQSALDIHYRSHTKERPFTCMTCNRGFSTKGNLKQHMLTHQMRDFPSNLFKPSTPNEASSHSSSLLSMLKTEMNSFHSSAFQSGKHLSGQSQSSSVFESPFSAVPPPRRTPKQHHCRTCGKSFSSSSALQIHERTHTGERPFACAVCGRAFTTKGNLKVHMGTHMWNSAPSRRGCRLSVDRSSLGVRTRPVKLPEPPQKNPAVVSNSRKSVYCRSEHPEVFSAGLK